MRIHHLNCISQCALGGALTDGRTLGLRACLPVHCLAVESPEGLILEGRHPVVCMDAVLSRKPVDREAGLELARAAGATLSSVEAVLFDLLGVAGTPEFKKISAAVK